MSDLAILQELGLPLFALREEEAPKPCKIEEIEAKTEPTIEATPAIQAPPAPVHYPFVVCMKENKADFSDEHRAQLEKIFGFLGYQSQDYFLVFEDDDFNSPCDIALLFGSIRKCNGKQSITTHSISMMLQNPACKREVLHAIQSLKKA